MGQIDRIGSARRLFKVILRRPLRTVCVIRNSAWAHGCEDIGLMRPNNTLLKL